MAPDEDDYLFERMGTGEVSVENLSEIVRAMRHHIRNEHARVLVTREIADTSLRLSKKSLDRIDDIIGVSGAEHLDGGGALGRMQSSMLRIETLLRRAQITIVFGSLALAGDIIIHFLPGGKV